MKESNRSLGTIRQLQGVLDFSDSELAARVRLYIEKCGDKLYCGDIVRNSGVGKGREDGYRTKEGRPFGEVITEVLLDSDWTVSPDAGCTYNEGRRKQDTEARRKKYPTFREQKAYCGDSETKLMQILAVRGRVGDFDVIDYQIPTSNGRTDKIDILLKKDGVWYMTEAKRFGSSESLVRCVLEIQTYYKKLNDRFYDRYGCKREALRRAVLFDEKSFAYKQLSYPWAKKLLDKFSVTVLVLSETENGYTVKEKTV